MHEQDQTMWKIQSIEDFNEEFQSSFLSYLLFFVLENDSARQSRCFVFKWFSMLNRNAASDFLFDICTT